MAKKIYKADVSQEVINKFFEFSSKEEWLSQHYSVLRGSRVQHAYTNLFSALGVVIVGAIILAFTNSSAPIIWYGPLAAGLIFLLYSLYNLAKAFQFKNLERNISSSLKEVCEKFYLNAIVNGKGNRLEGNPGDARTEMLWEISDVVPYFLYENVTVEVPKAASNWLTVRNQSIDIAYPTTNPFEKSKSLNKDFVLANYTEVLRENPDLADVIVSVNFWNKHEVEFHSVAARAYGNWFLLSLMPGDLSS